MQEYGWERLKHKINEIEIIPTVTNAGCIANQTIMNKCKNTKLTNHIEEDKIQNSAENLVHLPSSIRNSLNDTFPIVSNWEYQDLELLMI